MNLKESSREGGIYWKISGEGSHIVCGSIQASATLGIQTSLTRELIKGRGGDTGPGDRIWRGPGLQCLLSEEGEGLPVECDMI